MESCINPMLEDFYYGLVKLNGDWRLFCDSNRYKWALDLKQSNYVPPKRREHLTITLQNYKDFLSSLQTELPLSQIENSLGKILPNFIVNFDQHIFIDSDREEGESYGTYKMVPNNWRSVLFAIDLSCFLPFHIRNLWLTKHFVEENHIQKLVIYRYTEIAAIKTSSEWRFYFQQPSFWFLDYSAYINRWQHIPWPSDPVYEDFRKNIPLVDETNSFDFLEEASRFELANNEIPYLEYYLTDTDRYLIEEYRENGRIEDIRRLQKPAINVLINFDERIYVKRPPFGRTQLNTNPEEMLAPKHWICHHDNPDNYLPTDLINLWK